MLKFNGNEIDKMVEELEFSGVLRVIKDQTVLYSKVSGFADRSNELKNNPSTRFGTASGTKFFTALGIGVLIDSGKLNLSTKIADIIDLKDEFPSYDKDITIAHLLSHTSGIPDYFDEDLVDDFDNFKVSIPWNELKDPHQYLQVFPKTEMKFKPGTSFSYCNGGYILLAAIIAKVSGSRYVDFITKEIFEKQQMTKSGFYPLNALPKNTALGYIDTNDGWYTNIYNLPIVGGGDGGAFTCLEDVTKLWRAFYGYKILSKELTNQYLSKQAHSEKNIYYGYGLWIYQYDNAKIDCVMGCDAGVSFFSGRVKEKNIEYTLFSNTTEGVWPLGKCIREMILS